MTSGTARPLVTFALFAYNQEAYIREAVEGAFAQTYEPLEIILSDDCSSDRTFEIMQEMAAAYHGPHAVRVRQSEVNGGLASHINDVAGIASGEFVVMAAGDDISEPARTATCAEVFVREPHTFAVFCDVRVIPFNEKRTLSGFGSRTRASMTEIVFNRGGVQVGAAYAYRRECLIWPGPLPCWIYAEDRVLPYRAALLGQVKYVSQALVQYRVLEIVEEKTKRERRDNNFDHRRHFALLRDHLNEMRYAGGIGWAAYFYIYLIIRARERTLDKDKGVLVRIWQSFLVLALRFARKAAALIATIEEINRKEQVL